MQRMQRWGEKGALGGLITLSHLYLLAVEVGVQHEGPSSPVSFDMGSLGSHLEALL